MATRDKAKKTSPSNPSPQQKALKAPPVSQKQSIKERRAAQQRRRQQQQQIILGIVAVAFLAIVGLMIFVSTRPVEAAIPDETLTRYKPFAEAKLMGTTPEGFPYLGAENAPVVLEDISNFACSACAVYHDAVFLNLLDKIKAGDLKFVYIPLAARLSFDPEPATRGAICAAQQGKFWEMHEILFSWQARYGSDAGNIRRVQTAASSMGLDMGKFNDCLNNAASKAPLDKATEIANQRNIPGTPSIFLDGQLIQPVPEGRNSPSLSELRGLIEQKAAAKK